MKILIFSGGLGNQIFGYAFYCWLKKQFPQKSFYGVYNSQKLSEHNGLEIHKWFNVSLPKSLWITTLLTGIMYFYKQVFPNTKFLDLNQRECKNLNALIFYAFKLTNKYILPNEWISWKIKEEDLSSQNRNILQEIRTHESIFVHVRRGDYLSPKYKQRFEGTCPLEYYQKSINDIESEIKDPHYFCFSDDIEWAKQNLKLTNASYINWNIGNDSPIDMFLMSQCKYAIIANSTFSYWGAMLGIAKKKVYYPSKWINSVEGNPKIFPNNWKTF